MWAIVGSPGPKFDAGTPRAGDRPWEGRKGVRDVYRTVLDVFRTKRMVAWYTMAMVALAVHLREGWNFAPRNLVAQGALPKKFKREATSIGNRLITPLCVGFAAIPVYAHYLSSKRRRPQEGGEARDAADERVESDDEN